MLAARETRSGSCFSPYVLSAVKPARVKQGPPLISGICIDSMVKLAVEIEETSFLENYSCAEGYCLSSRPASPLTEFESETDAPEENINTKKQHTYDSVEKERKKISAKARRKKKRKSLAELEHKPTSYTAKPSTVNFHSKQTNPLKIALDTQAIPSGSAGSWIGQRTRDSGTAPRTVAECRKDGFVEIEWTGETTRFILDSDERIIMVLVGHPNDPGWRKVIDDSTDALAEVRELGLAKQLFDAKNLDHRRGDFVALPTGVSFGGGQIAPGNLVHTRGRRRLVDHLLKNKSIQRIAGFQSSAFAAYAPKLYRYFAETLGALFSHHIGLVHNFSNSIFPAISFNCGPQTVSCDHTDYGNLSHGLCALTALGRYDATQGGHLVATRLKIMVQFPPGSTILLPSGFIEHGNTPVQAGEIRMSIAQYAAGGLFRWVAYGYRSAKSLLKTKAGKREKQKIDMAPSQRWLEGLEMFSKFKELQADVERIYVGNVD